MRRPSCPSLLESDLEWHATNLVRDSPPPHTCPSCRAGRPRPMWEILRLLDLLVGGRPLILRALKRALVLHPSRCALLQVRLASQAPFTPGLSPVFAGQSASRRGTRMLKNRPCGPAAARIATPRRSLCPFGSYLLPAWANHSRQPLSTPSRVASGPHRHLTSDHLSVILSPVQRDKVQTTT